MTKYPFEVLPDELDAEIDAFVDVVISTLESEFIVVPRGEGFIEYPTFEKAFEELKRTTAFFRDLDPEQVGALVVDAPLVLIVLRTMLGFTPSEWAYVATRQTGISITQGYIRALDRRIRKTLRLLCLDAMRSLRP